jgi:hypothetical protein
VDWDGVIAIVLITALVAAMWKLNRYFERSGRIFAVPFSIDRDRLPRFFRVTMVLNWIVFAIVALFAVLLTAALVTSWT